MPSGTCKFCGHNGVFAKSHIVPRSFYLTDQQVSHMVISLDRNERPKRSHTGIWDDTFLCRQCEDDIFDRVDDYAFKHLLGGDKKLYVCSGDDGVLLINGAQPIGLYTHASIEMLKAFAISVLWRASASNRPEMSGAKTAEEKFFHDALQTNQFANYQLGLVRETNRDLYGFVCVIGEWLFKKAVLYRFTAGGYTFLVKRSDTPAPVGLEFLFEPYKGMQFLLCKSETRSVFWEQISTRAKSVSNIFGGPWSKLKKV